MAMALVPFSSAVAKLSLCCSAGAQVEILLYRFWIVLSSVWLDEDPRVGVHVPLA